MQIETMLYLVCCMFIISHPSQNWQKNTLLKSTLKRGPCPRLGLTNASTSPPTQYDWRDDDADLPFQKHPIFRTVAPKKSFLGICSMGIFPSQRTWEERKKSSSWKGSIPSQSANDFSCCSCSTAHIHYDLCTIVFN